VFYNGEEKQMNYIVLYILLSTVAFCNSVVTMNQQSYTIDDFYKVYGKKEWDKSDSNQKQDLINDFINRKLSALEATKIGLQNKPDITKRLYNRNQIALVNITYEELVARPLVSQESLDKLVNIL